MRNRRSKRYWKAKSRIFREPLIKSHAVATLMQSGCRARRKERRLVVAKPATNNNAMRTGIPDSDSRERGAGRGACCRKKHCKMVRSCCRSRTPSFADRVAAAPVPSGCGKMQHLRRARRSVEPRVRATAKASAGPLRCTALQVRRCAGPPRLRSLSYDLRRAPRIPSHFASNAIRGGLNQRFLICAL